VIGSIAAVLNPRGVLGPYRAPWTAKYNVIND